LELIEKSNLLLAAGMVLKQADPAPDGKSNKNKIYVTASKPARCLQLGSQAQCHETV
jgi:hypothetical protein